MNYPLISEYIEAIKSAEDNFEELSYLRPVLGDDGMPVMTSGNFAVVFKMKDEETGKLYALKCFTKEQEGREEAYHQIAEELKDVDSPYLVSLRYLDKELFVDTGQTDETEFPVLLMDWVEGKTLDKYLRENLDDKYALEMLAYRFSQLAQWLIPQPFAHGDLKPDNILVREDGTLVLVDYDGMYVPAMKGQKARELGSPDFRHPLRTENDFNEHIDDFSVVSILLSLIAISIDSLLLTKKEVSNKLLFSEKDYYSIDNNNVISILLSSGIADVCIIASIFIALCRHVFPIKIPALNKPYDRGKICKVFLPGVNNLSNRSTLKIDEPLTMIQLLEGLDKLNDLMNANGIDYILTGSLGLYIYGFIPYSYVPHDIDIIVKNGKNLHSDFSTEQLLDLFCQHSGGKGTIYIDSDLTKMFSFNIGIHKININAFLYDADSFNNVNYVIMRNNNYNIKVSSLSRILKEKYKLQRIKDYKFNNDIQAMLNLFFSS